MQFGVLRFVIVERWTYQSAQDQGVPVTRALSSARREPGLVNLLTSQAWNLCGATYLRLAHRLCVVGREHLPKRGPFVMAANHCSHLDAACLTAALPARLRHEAFPVAAGDAFFDTRAHAALAALFVNAVPMQRRNASRHALEDLRSKLIETRCILLIFPEGTRSRDGRMGAFKAGLGMLVAGTNVPVVPCHLSGTFQALPPGARRARFCRVGVRIGRAVEFGEIANDRAGWEQVGASVEERVRRLALKDVRG